MLAPGKIPLLFPVLVSRRRNWQGARRDSVPRHGKHPSRDLALCLPVYCHHQTNEAFVIGALASRGVGRSLTGSAAPSFLKGTGSRVFGPESPAANTNNNTPPQMTFQSRAKQEARGASNSSVWHKASSVRNDPKVTTRTHAHHQN